MFLFLGSFVICVSVPRPFVRNIVPNFYSYLVQDRIGTPEFNFQHCSAICGAGVGTVVVVVVVVVVLVLVLVFVFVFSVFVSVFVFVFFLLLLLSLRLLALHGDVLFT